MCYKVFMWRTENLFSYSLSRKLKFRVLIMGQFLFKCSIWMRLFIWKRDCYPQSTDEEIEFSSHSLQAVGLTFEAKQSAPENVSTTMNSWLLFKENRWCGGNILGSDGRRINSAGLTCREKSPCSEIYNEAEKVVGLESDSVLWPWASQLEMMKGDIF